MDICMVDKSYAYLDNKRLEMSEEWGTLFLVGPLPMDFKFLSQDILDELLLIYLSINEVEFIWISPCFSQVL